jgi:uncharacterized membrane protein YdjX (TVP38/TMEM64 family)
VSRRRWRLLLLCIAGLVLFVSVRRAIGLDLQPDSLRAAVEGLGFWAPLAFVGIVTFRVPLGVPSAVALIGGGLVFGVAAGTLYGAIGMLISALVVFTTARWAGRESIEGRVPERLRYVLDIAGSRAGAAFIALGSAYPMSPVTSYHLIAGVTAMSAPMFIAAATVGCGARSALYTWFGSSLVEADPFRMLAAGGLLLASLVLPLVFPPTRRWLLGAFASRSHPG